MFHYSFCSFRNLNLGTFIKDVRSTVGGKFIHFRYFMVKSFSDLDVQTFLLQKKTKVFLKYVVSTWRGEGLRQLYCRQGGVNFL